MLTPWHDWEDYQAGLYGVTVDDALALDAANLLNDSDQFHEAALEMIRSWPTSATHNLGNLRTGHNAWIGQATCCYTLGATSATTRLAWGMLTNGEQRAANRVAQMVRERWVREGQDAQTLFGH